MEITQPTQGSATVASPTISSAAAQTSTDFEVFLKMLTAQMQYQDPLNPIDSTDYATQLATFSGVEQAVLTNDLLKSLTTQMSMGGLVDMAALVGKDVRSTAPAYFDGQPLTLLPGQRIAADTAELVVRNAAGDEVQRSVVSPAAETLEWAGVGPSGAPFTTGVYQFEIVSKSNGEIIAQTPVETYSTVTEVRLNDGAITLLLSGGASVASDQVTALREGNL